MRIAKIRCENLDEDAESRRQGLQRKNRIGFGKKGSTVDLVGESDSFVTDKDSQEKSVLTGTDPESEFTGSQGLSVNKQGSEQPRRPSIRITAFDS